jgi:hypothetical protein
MSNSPPPPIYFKDPAIPPIYGYLPYGKYIKKKEWVVRTPCQPSIIPMADPNGAIFLTYEHPLGSDLKGKNTADTFVGSITGSAKALTGSMALLGSAVSGKVARLFK